MISKSKGITEWQKRKESLQGEVLEKKQQIALTELCHTTPTETGLREIHFYAAQDSLCASSSTGEMIQELRSQREKIAPVEMSTNTYKYKSKKNTLKKSCSK